MIIEELRDLCHDETIEVSGHFVLRSKERGISFSEVKEIILHGSIIEDYPEDYPFPSCLILGKTTASRALHVVVGTDGKRLWLITAYEPSSDIWNETFTKRIERN